MRLTLLASIFALCPIPALAQQCELTLEQAPELRGFKLGMTPVKAQAGLRGAVFPKPDRLGLQTVKLSPVALRRSAPQASDAVKGGELWFLDGTLMRIIVVYDDSVGWKNVDEFAFSVSQALGLPPVWPRKKDPYEDIYEYRFAARHLHCSGFMVSVYLKGSRTREAVLEIQDMRLDDLIADRKRELEERKKAGFKP